MNPLRKLAKGHEYRVSEPNGALLVLPTKGTFYWEYSKAPASCFADVEEPLRAGDRVVVVNEPTLEDGKTPSVLSGCAGKHGILHEIFSGSLIGFVRFDDDTTRSDWLHNLRRERPDERPAEKKPDPEGWKREFYPTDASECSIENAVAHSLQKWRGYRKAELKRYGLDAPPIPANNHHCAVCKHYLPRGCSVCPLAAVAGDPCGGSDTYDAWSKDDNPEPMITALKKCLEQERAKHEPKPEPLLRRFMPGQWVQLRDMRGTISFYDPHLRAYSVRVRQGPGSGEDWWWHAESCIPCVPVITNEMKLLCWTGNRVRVIQNPADENGVPICEALHIGEVALVALVCRNQRVECRFGENNFDTVLPWNLDPV